MMNDLTVQTIHTYYVLAGNTPVLVHNTGPCGGTIPNESLDVINSIRKDGVIVQSGVKGPVTPETFLNDGRNGGMILPRTTAAGDAITYREWEQFLVPVIQGREESESLPAPMERFGIRQTTTRRS